MVCKTAKSTKLPKIFKAHANSTNINLLNWILMFSVLFIHMYVADSVHSTSESYEKKRIINVPSEYIDVCKNAQKKNP